MKLVAEFKPVVVLPVLSSAAMLLIIDSYMRLVVEDCGFVPRDVTLVSKDCSANVIELERVSLTELTIAQYFRRVLLSWV